jgi:uncharacterized NAD(P)/FAD-binding protein YdhS
VSAVRELVADAERAGGDWREAVSFVRTVAPTLWQRMPSAERRRFLRHARSYWDVHRHRIAPAAGAVLNALINKGRIILHAGRLTAFHEGPAGARIQFRDRATGTQHLLGVDRVINCTGPESDFRRINAPLWRQLREDGLAVPDELGLGLRTGPDGAVFDREGWPGPRLFYLGPMLRADHWEATAALELRDRGTAGGAAGARRLTIRQRYPRACSWNSCA